MINCLQCDKPIYTLNNKMKKTEYKKSAKVAAVVCGNCVQERLKGRKFGLTEDLKRKARMMGFGELLESLEADLGTKPPDGQDSVG